MESKICKECGVIKNITDEFPKNGRIYRAVCKPCHSNKQKERYEKKNEDERKQHLEKRKEFYVKNKDDILKINKEYRKQNRDVICEQKKKYYLKNRDEILKETKTKDYREKRNKYLQKRRKNDKFFSMINAYRVRINEVLQKQKKNTYITYLNCKREQFLDWLEFQFNGEYIWEDYGKKWVIDHVIPIAFFDLENKDHIQRCFNWFNLRPCNKDDNLKKSDKIVLDIVEDHQNNINNFLKINNWYQADVEIYQWLREKLRYGENPSVLDNSQPNF